MSTPLYLDQPAKGFHGLITSIDGDMATRRKLMSLGLRQGQTVDVLHQRRNGVVVMSNGSRIALGAGVAGQIQLRAIDNDDC
ncbi:MAG: ferrous iron transport protein A [Gammaproteobacteria bacterium]|nr:ferrous iron transport protein A [Gammaproteobacteria bacterium]